MLLKGFHTLSRVLNKVEIPQHLQEYAKVSKASIIPPTLQKDKLTIPEFERLRIVPHLNTYYGGNPLHDFTVARLNTMIRKYLHLPTRQLNFQESQEIRFMGFDEYKNTYIKSDKIKQSHHREVIGLLNQLRTIDAQLMPQEVVDTLNEFIGSTQNQVIAQKKVKTLDENGVISAKGRRKTSVANVKVVDGEGHVLVNGKSYTEVFTRDIDRSKISFPLLVLEKVGKLNIWATVRGGGISSQADAVKFGIIKALSSINPIWKSRLRQAGLKLTDTRIVERKKPGKLKARKSPAWVKR